MYGVTITELIKKMKMKKIALLLSLFGHNQGL